MIKYLVKKGFFVTSRTGSHVVLSNRITVTSVPAGNKTLKKGLLLSVLGDAQISRDAFIKDYSNKIVK